MFYPKRKEELLKRMRLSSQQVKSMKCRNEISRQGNDIDNHFKGIFSIVLNGFVFLGQLLKANEIKKSLVNNFYFVFPSQKR